jgi:CCR4-NOT transcription complex subunit 3
MCHPIQVHNAPNHNQKDRYEQELKKEIKKLQRLRDQIKTWLSSTEIKDKTCLQDARRNIEQVRIQHHFDRSIRTWLVLANGTIQSCRTRNENQSVQQRRSGCRSKIGSTRKRKRRIHPMDSSTMRMTSEQASSMIEHVQEAIQELNIQMDKFESDIESLSVGLKKKKSDKDVSLW